MKIRIEIVYNVPLLTKFYHFPPDFYINVILLKWFNVK